MTSYAQHGDPDYNSKTAAGCEQAGEPVFTLRAQDVHAAATVRFWARQVTEAATARPADPQVVPEIAGRAMLIADEMDRWPDKKEPD